MNTKLEKYKIKLIENNKIASNKVKDYEGKIENLKIELVQNILNYIIS